MTEPAPDPTPAPDQPEPDFAARPAMHWVEYRHADGADCPDPERLGFTPSQWVEAPDAPGSWWPGVECGGCGQPLEATG